MCVSVCLRSSSLTVGPKDLKFDTHVSLCMGTGMQKAVLSVLFGSLLALQKWNLGINTVSGGEREVRQRWGVFIEAVKWKSTRI